MAQPIIDERALLACCGSRRWGELMLATRPFDSPGELLTASRRAFDALSREDWLEAFGAHSAIGAVRSDDPVGGGEQAGVHGADPALRAALAAGNAEYLAQFGFVFLIRARDRSAEEILAQLRERLANPPEVEFANACEQQREITALRLEGFAS